VPDPASQIVVTAMGPLGHLYFPVPQDTVEKTIHAEQLVHDAGIPLVLFLSDKGTVLAFNSRGNWTLPADRAKVLGADHPFLNEAAEDLIRLCGHPDAGDIVISGWDPSSAAAHISHGEWRARRTRL
jgi:hypothetical protein